MTIRGAIPLEKGLSLHYSNMVLAYLGFVRCSVRMHTCRNIYAQYNMTRDVKRTYTIQTLHTWFGGRVEGHLTFRK